MGEVLILKREPDNSRDFSCSSSLEGRARCRSYSLHTNLAPTGELFLRREVNMGFVEVNGARVNRGAGYGLEIPCKYRLYGPKVYCDKLKQVLLYAGLVITHFL